MKRSLEIESVVRRMWKAFVERDRDALVNLSTDHPDARVVLAADDEWIKPYGRLADILIDRADQIGLVSAEIDRLEAFEHGDAGWFAANVTVFRSTGDPVTFRSTGVFIIEAGVWRATQIHTSIGVPNADSYGYQITKGLSDLVDSLDEENADSVASASRSGTVTLMFTDIEDSTIISERVGDSEWTSLIERHFGQIHRVVEPMGGTVIKTLGDGAMIAFPAVREAVLAAIDLQRATAAAEFRIRVGIHTGDAVRSFGDYAGIAVNKAARIASAADGDEILTSSVTAELAGSNEFQLGLERVAELKGLSGTHRLIPILWDTLAEAE
jgi:class 3 adenylate cyclase